jgi:hypothetical protein
METGRSNQVPAPKSTVYGYTGDKFRNQYYDTATLANGTNIYNMFQTRVGGAVTKAQTNMQDAGQFPTNIDFYVERIGIRISPPVNAAPAAVVSTRAAEIFAVLAGSTLTLNMTSKQNYGEWAGDTFMNVVNLALTPVVAGDGVQATVSTTQAPMINVGKFTPTYSIDPVTGERVSNNTAIPLLERNGFGFVFQQFDLTTGIPAGLAGYRIKVLIDGWEIRRK